MGKLESRRVEDVQLSLPFKPFAIVTVSLPAFSLLYCFLHGIIFRFNDVNETVCKVIRLCLLSYRIMYIVATFHLLLSFYNNARNMLFGRGLR